MCRLGNISPAVFLKLVFVLFLFGYNNYVYRDVGTYSKSIKTSTNALLETTENSN